VRLIGSASLDPPPQLAPLVASERFDAFERRHSLGVIVRIDSAHQLAFANIARYDCDRARFGRTGSLLAKIEPQSGLAISLIWAMALKALVGKNRPNVAAKF
jgi:hypothetical protein